MDEMLKLKLTNAELIKENIRLTAELTQLKVDRFRSFTNEECWIYEENANNYLHTLVCPVVIKVKTLIKLLEAAQ